MFNFVKLLSTATLLLLLLISAGCDQPDDVLTPVAQSTLTLAEQRLPDNPPGMIYELWVADASDTLSLGKFSYDFKSRTFMNSSGAVIQPVFELDADINAYDVIFVSVENDPDSDINSPGPIMLIDSTSSATLELRFPKSDDAWESIIRYNMVGVSDGINAATNGSGVWLSNYTYRSATLVDTLGIDNWFLDSIEYIDSTAPVASVNVRGIDSNTIAYNQVNRVFGLDTIVQQTMEFDYIITYDTSEYWVTQINIDYILDSTTIFFDDFSQDEFGVPYVGDFGWHYKGWVISRHIDSAVTASLTYPAWPILGSEFDQATGGMLTIGRFNYIDSADMDDMYLDTTFKNPPRKPAFPGEDFMRDLPGSMTGPLNLVPNDDGNNGVLMITAEPDNYSDDQTNFPLVMYIGNLPEERDSVLAVNQGFTLNGKMYTNDPYRGFPLITVTVSK